MRGKKIQINCDKQGRSYAIVVAKNQKVIQIHRAKNGINFAANYEAMKILTPNAYVLLANLYSSSNRLEEAVTLYKKAIQAAPNDPETYMLLGNVHYLNKDLEQAIQAYRASISLAPDNDEYRLIYSQVMEDYVKSVRGVA